MTTQTTQTPVARHQYVAVPDTRWPHLYQPRCSCGWRRAGFTTAWVAMANFNNHFMDVAA